MAADQHRSSFDLKSAHLPVVAVMIKSADLTVLRADLAARIGSDSEFFDNDPVLLDLSAIHDSPDALDFSALLQDLRQYRTRPVAVRGGNTAQMQAAHDAGLIAAPDAPHGPTAVSAPRQVVHEVVQEVIREVQVSVPAPGALVVDKPLRSGQRVYARDTDVVVLAMVSFGAEVIADGNVHVYAPLRGRAVAGARGNTQARIFSTCMEPQLVSIAGIYRALETDLPADVRGKSAQVRLDGEKLLIEPL